MLILNVLYNLSFSSNQKLRISSRSCLQSVHWSVSFNHMISCVLYFGWSINTQNLDQELFTKYAIVCFSQSEAQSYYVIPLVYLLPISSPKHPAWVVNRVLIGQCTSIRWLVVFSTICFHLLVILYFDWSKLSQSKAQNKGQELFTEYAIAWFSQSEAQSYSVLWLVYF